MKHYTEEDDHNKLLYHNRSEDTDSKMMQVLKDAALLITACDSRYDETSEYQLLIRVLNEQTMKDDNGTLSLRSSHSEMNSEILQNPADPDATYRKKAGKEHRGYIKCKLYFGFKIAAMNTRKLVRYLSSQNRYALNPKMAGAQAYGIP